MKRSAESFVLLEIVYNDLTLDSDNNILLCCLQLVEVVVKKAIS